MRDHSNERGHRPVFASCGNCGGYPAGTGCYHICHNSVHFYSPEQERADEPWYGMDDNYERYAAERADMANEGAYESMYEENELDCLPSCKDPDTELVETVIERGWRNAEKRRQHELDNPDSIPF